MASARDWLVPTTTMFPVAVGRAVVSVAIEIAASSARISAAIEAHAARQARSIVARRAFATLVLPRDLVSDRPITGSFGGLGTRCIGGVLHECGQTSTAKLQ
jgi:hypothetical protein